MLLVHFVLTQCRPILVFAVSVDSFLTLMTNWLITHCIAGDEEAMAAFRHTTGSNLELGCYVDCVLKESAQVHATFASNVTMPCIGPISNKYFELHVADNVVLTGVILISVALVGVFVLVLTIELIGRSRANFGQGAYLTFTFNVQKSLPYKICTVLVILYATVCFGGTCAFLFRLYFRGQFTGRIESFASSVLPSLAGLVYSAISFMLPTPDPETDYTSQGFQELQFARSFSSLLKDNNEFYSQVGHAALDYHLGQQKEWTTLLGLGAIAKQVLDSFNSRVACHPDDASEETKPLCGCGYE